MPIGIKFRRTLTAALASAALLTGCTAGHGHKIRLPRVNLWPQCWGQAPTMFSKPNPQVQPEYQQGYDPNAEPEYMPIPADPSGSPYPPNSPRGLYIPVTPAPGSKLGLPVPPPLPPGAVEESPTPEGVRVPEPEAESLPLPVPPAAEDMDVSYDERLPKRTVVAPPPPREPNDAADAYAPRLAERTDPYDRNRQPVDLELPELESEAALTQEVFPDDPGLDRSPVEPFPKPRMSNDSLERGPGHTPALDQTDEALPMGIDPSSHRPAAQRQGLPGPTLPILRDPSDSDLAFPGGHRQMSGESIGGFVKLDRAISRLTVTQFRLTRSVRTGIDAAVISAKNVRRGVELAVQSDIEGLEKIQRNGELVSRITCHVEICDASNSVVYRTDKQSSAEVTRSSDSVRHVTHRLTLPARLKATDYVLQLHVRDDIARQVTVVEMPVTVR